MSDLADIAASIWAREKALEFRGSDPYDGLNSRLLSPVLGWSKYLRLALIQAVKRSPIDLRRILGVQPRVNPKGLALYLSSIMSWLSIEETPEYWRAWLQDELLSKASLPDGRPLVSPERQHVEGIRRNPTIGKRLENGAIAWGYSFPWQGRRFYQPAWAPTVVCTSFVLDALTHSKAPLLTQIAGATARFVADHLNVHEDGTGICFSYSPQDSTRVYNASLFGARILAEGARYSEDHTDSLRSMACRAAEYVLQRQEESGRWVYGEAGHWQWTDNLHTGFVLESLMKLQSRLGLGEWREQIQRGLDYYQEHLFLPDGTARYYSTSTKPLDPHSFAQGAITLTEAVQLGYSIDVEPRQVLLAAVKQLWDEERRGFLYRPPSPLRQSMIHSRWSQAWMLRAITAYLDCVDNE